MRKRSSSPSLVSAHIVDENSTGIYVIHHPGADIAQGVKIYIHHRDDFRRQKFPIKDNAAAMTCLLRKSSLLTFTICANRPRRHEGQLTTFNHFDPRRSTHGSSYGITAGGTRQPGRVDRRSRGLVHLKAKRK
jgi:hypothetical protein